MYVPYFLQKPISLYLNKYYSHGHLNQRQKKRRKRTDVVQVICSNYVFLILCFLFVTCISDVCEPYKTQSVWTT